MKDHLHDHETVVGRSGVLGNKVPAPRNTKSRTTSSCALFAFLSELRRPARRRPAGARTESNLATTQGSGRSQAKQQFWTRLVGQERVVASVKLDDSAGLAARSRCNRWCAFVLSADEIGRGTCCQAAAPTAVPSRARFAARACLQPGLVSGHSLAGTSPRELRADTKSAAVRVDVEERAGVPSRSRKGSVRLR